MSLADFHPGGAAARVPDPPRINWKRNLLFVWLAKSTPDHRRGVFFGWATSIKSFGWFVSSLAGGGVAMAFGVRWVFLVTGLLFLALIPIVRTASRRIAAAG